jgi:hypothetical protein
LAAAIPRWATRTSPASCSVTAETTCYLLISLGYPAGRSLSPIQTPDRRPLTDLVHRDRW